MKNNSIYSAMRTVVAFALPVSSAGIINMISSFIAMMMVAQLGKEQLAAGALGVTTYITMMTVMATIFYAVGILISHHTGQDKLHAEIGLVVKNGIWLAILLSFPAAFMLWHADKILLLFGQEPQLVEITRSYFYYAGLCMFPLLINAVIFQFFAGTGRPKLTMLAAIISLPVAIFTSYCFILGHFGMPKLGLGGITYAGLVTQSVMMICIVIALYIQDVKYQLFAHPFAPNWVICKSIFSLGLPIGIQFGGEIAAMSIATYMMGYFGVAALAASQVVSQYSLLVVMISLGLTQALSILISKAYGQHDLKLIKMYLHASMLILVGLFVVVGILFCFFPEKLIIFYVDKKSLDSQMMYLGSLFFIIGAFVLFFDAIRHLLSGALRGLHDSRAPMRIGVITWTLANYTAMLS